MLPSASCLGACGLAVVTGVACVVVFIVLPCVLFKNDGFAGALGCGVAIGCPTYVGVGCPALNPACVVSGVVACGR